MTEKRYFGTDGIRGRVGHGPISADFVLRLGWAVGRALAKGGRPTVVIGKDTRISGYMFESALEAGLVAAGADVRLLGPMPTPGVAYLTRSLRADAGIVISASHNPHYDNGIKFFSALGEKLSDELELAIEAALELPFDTVPSENLGKAARVDAAAARYAEFCKGTVGESMSLRGLKLAVDCANGATYQIAPKLFEELGAQLVAKIGVEPDGLNINAGCGSTHPAAVQEAVRMEKADLGIAFDGDGDRLIMVDSEGSVADGDDLLYVLACDRHLRGVLQGPVVGTLMTNFGFEQALQRRGIGFVRARVGDRYVHRMLVELGGVLGGEASGHLLCLDKATTGDGIVSALQVLEVVQRSGRTLRTLLEGLVKVPQRTLNVPVTPGLRVAQHPGVCEALAGAERELEGRGRVVLRPSGTEPVVRVTVEADDEGLLERTLQRLAEAVREAA
ncbi:MAG TPA: phosphoglucosamine mutase [Xanthomonadaceae bacterium]|nr:phosphoglucosamine mutase [Xanthomonadaceae bacterium]